MKILNNIANKFKVIFYFIVFHMGIALIIEVHDVLWPHHSINLVDIYVNYNDFICTTCL